MNDSSNDLLAGWLLRQAGRAADDSVRTVCLLDSRGCARRVPWARDVEQLTVAWRSGGQWLVDDVRAGSVCIRPETNLAGEPRDDVDLDMELLSGPPVDAEAMEELAIRGGLIRAIQICGALDRMVGLCVDHASTRQQFGRSIGRFQAVRTMLADAASESALANAATVAAVDSAANGSPDPFAVAVAVARSCATHAAASVSRIAHQIRGAIGTTAEHDLHRYTLAAQAWRSEFGSTAQWDDLVGGIAAEAGGAELWALLTG
ncbi:acyl-CoA dehydrogenase family protein [Gordonia sp. (in: high G+C Gram-positive bacteria)]|uniref:acyl-CoA dehydrogenase family protein n=1 Tax=Gordonia sp. (in: high G+C Gram-positive bacteria) TaxID=84139 RepID=UPI0026106214|nr:acyl-CoA dehydrogenase family protein [Gordonia sp. (in: high G+C Gram-positive bacteria)]